MANSFYDWFTDTLPTKEDADIRAEVVVPRQLASSPISCDITQDYRLIVAGQPWWSANAAMRRSNPVTLIQEAAAALPDSDMHLDFTDEVRRVIAVAVRRLRVEHPDAANWLAQEAAK